jgi:hypothetical protein
MKRLLISVVAGLCVCSATISAQVRELPSPAGTGSGQPNLAVSPDGHVYLSWIERLGEGRFSLRFATLEKDGWSTPRVIAEGSNWFVNWADFPLDAGRAGDVATALGLIADVLFFRPRVNDGHAGVRGVRRHP